VPGGREERMMAKMTNLRSKLPGGG
jgi:hypothetical protein